MDVKGGPLYRGSKCGGNGGGLIVPYGVQKSTGDGQFRCKCGYE